MLAFCVESSKSANKSIRERNFVFFEFGVDFFSSLSSCKHKRINARRCFVFSRTSFRESRHIKCGLKMTFEEEESDADDDQKRCHFPISSRETFGVDFEFSKSSSFKEEEEDISLSELKERKRRSKGRASRSNRKSAFDAFKLLSLLFSGIRKAYFGVQKKSSSFEQFFSFFFNLLRPTVLFIINLYYLKAYYSLSLSSFLPPLPRSNSIKFFDHSISPLLDSYSQPPPGARLGFSSSTR